MHIGDGAIKSKKLAVIVSYAMVFANTLSNLILTPMYLHYLGLDMYGLYQMVYAVAHYILILDFGVGTAMVRYISGYHARNDYESEKNFSAHCLGIVLIIDALIVVAGVIINSQLLNIYPTISTAEASLAHGIFIIMICTIALTIVERFVQGSIMAYEHFTIVRFIALCKVVTKFLLSIIMLVCDMGVIAIVLADLIVTFFSILAMGVYSFAILKFKIKFSYIDKILIGSICSFMLAIFLQSVVQYVNNVVDKTILGIMTRKQDVAVYSVAMTFITLFNSLPSEISGVFLPNATKLVSHNADGRELTNFIIRPGRYQFIMCGAIIAGFFLFGKEFICIWSGEDTIQSWNIALVIMIPNMIPLIENTVISILDAKKKRLFRSLVLFGISVFNIIISVFLVSTHGMMGAPIGTALAYLVGYGIVMNIYYKRVIGIEVARMFKEIISRTWICILFASVVSAPLNIVFKNYGLFSFALKLVTFCVAYFSALCVYGFNEREKNDLKSILRRFHIRKN